MAGYQKINLGNQPNDGLGDSGRAGGQKLNSMNQELFESTFVNASGVRVTRRVLDPANEDLTSYRVDDKCEAWEDSGTKQRWVEGIVMGLPFAFPADIDDPSKFFITNEKLRA